MPSSSTSAPSRPATVLQLYAQHLPADPGERDHALTRLLDHYQTLTEQADVHLRPPSPAVPPTTEFPDRNSALAWLDAELDNLTATLTTPPTSDHHREYARDLPLTLANYLDSRRHFNLKITLTTTSRYHAQYFGDRYAEGAALINLGLALRDVRRFEEAITALTDATAISRETGDRHGESTALNNLGAALRQVRRFDEAITALTDAATIYRETNDRHGEGTALNNLGNALLGRGRFVKAIKVAYQAELLRRELGE
jgi:tetratricopeptide (TPR) repeat protein